MIMMANTIPSAIPNIAVLLDINITNPDPARPIKISNNTPIILYLIILWLFQKLYKGELYLKSYIPGHYLDSGLRNILSVYQ